jgi:type VI secretion system secreted protein Hcp
MAVDAFMKFEGIKGESTDPQHPSEIEVLSWSWGAGVPPTEPAGSAIDVHDFSFVHRVDLASPRLMTRCANGEHIPSGLMSVRRENAKGQPLDYIKVTFTDVLVSSFQVSGGGGAQPVEEVSFNFAKVEFSYQKVLGAGGLGTPVIATIDNPQRG